ncbi:MAG TPA: multiheme c-type cytochrome [Polyangiales bacterium]|nr:multiheme c-type cytochrome [Polyangiales bacterium]
MLLDRDQLLDPEECRSCHPGHYEEWASSMHAYAADDPVFLAMNQRGQRETEGELGDFCVKCHAPMAVREGATRDGLNLADVPAKLKGITCYFCHNASSVGEHFNNDVQLANDTTMRAALEAPIRSPAHALGFSPHLDSNRRESGALCGSCHDVVVPSGVHLERTFVEYQKSLFGQLEEGFETCAGCHMPGRKGRRAAELPGAPLRIVHEHLWPAVDVALTPFPGIEVQRRAVECELALNTRIRQVTHDGFGTFTVQTETSAGHNQPSGTAQDRRMWIEVVAYDASDVVIFESGTIADGEVEQKEAGDPAYDPQLTLYRDWTYRADGAYTHNFWEVAPSAAHPEGYEALTLPFTTDPNLAHTLSARYAIARHREIARMTIRLRLRPIGMDVLEDLVASGDLDAAVPARMPTFTLHGAAVEWRPNEPVPRSLLPDDFTCSVQ